jgi:predicted nucleic acid-binding protein
MPNKAIYDTRFFIELFYQKDPAKLNQLKEELRQTQRRHVSTVTIYEQHRIDIHLEGKTIANLRSEAIQRDFTVTPLDYTTSIKAAQISEQYRTPLADSVIAAHALQHNLPVVSDDPHFKQIKDLKTKWPLK